jgi:Concanavalin A-like lectin/glucanases superfamily
MIPSLRSTAKVLAPIVVTLGLVAPPAGASTIDIGKIRGWWPMNEGRGQTVYDWSGNRNHGTLGSTAGVDANDPTWIKGIFWGSALNFSGDDFVSIPSSTSLAPNTFTVSLWTRAPQSPGQFKYLLAKGSNQCVAAAWGLWTSSNGGLEFYVWDGFNLVRSNSIVNGIWDGRWHNVSATYDGTSAMLFVDGKNIGTGLPSSRPVDYSNQPDGTTTFGGYRGSCDLLFNGDIDQVMLFDKVLPIEQIWARFGFILGQPTLG